MLFEKRYKIKAVISLAFIMVIFVSLSLPTASTQHCSGLPLRITTTSLPNPELNKDYSATISASGGKPSYRWQLKPGTNPPRGLIFSAQTCTLGANTYYPKAQITGKPTTAGTYKFTIELSDGSETDSMEYTLEVGSGTLAITTISLPDATVGQSYTAWIEATPKTTP